MLFAVYSAILFLISILGFIGGDRNEFQNYYGILIIFLIGYIVVYYRSGVKDLKQLYNWGLRPTYLCLLGLIIVNLQLFCDDIIGTVDIIDSSSCNWAESISDRVFFGGYIFVLSFILANYYTKHSFVSKSVNNETTRIYNLTPWIILAGLSFTGFIATINISHFISGEVYLGSGASDASTDSSQSFEHLLQVFCAITLVLYSLNNTRTNNYHDIKHYIKGIPCLFWIIFICYMGLRIPSGDRGPIMFNSLLIFYTFTIYSGRTIGLKYSFILLVCAIFLVSVFGYIRAMDTSLNFSERFDEALVYMDDVHKRETSSFSPYTSELAHSVRCNFVAVRDIDSYDKEYAKGRFFILTTISAIPGSKTKYLNDLGFANENIRSSVYITKSYNGTNYYSFGLGSSAFAEAYLEFGILGVILTGLVLGWFFKKVDLTFLNPKYISVYILLFIIQISSISFYISRSSISQAFGKGIYICALFYIISTILPIMGFKIYKNIS